MGYDLTYITTVSIIFNSTNQKTCKFQKLTCKKSSMWIIRAWVRLMINWLTQASAWDLGRKFQGISIFYCLIFETTASSDQKLGKGKLQT